MDMMEKLSLAGLVPVIKVEDAADAVPLCRALAKGGLPVAEITFRSEAAEEAIRRVHEELPEVMLGAGTVLTKEQVDRAVAAGAAYIVSPGLNREIVRYCREKKVSIIPGCANPSDIEVALEEGLKIYPQLLINVPVKDKEAAMQADPIVKEVAAINEELHGNGRILVRPSGTEPLVRVMVEAESDELCHHYVYRVVDLIEKSGL